jgi:histidine ammonia-lyase
VTADAIRRALTGSRRTGADAGLSVQDPLSFRVVPQVHGAARDVLDGAARDLTAELNAAADNPLVDVASGRVVSNGNFHPMNVALAAESLRVALAHVGLLAERRMGRLWDTAVTAFGSSGTDGAGPPLEGGTPPWAAGLALRYPAAARYTRLRHLAQPVTLDVPVLDLGVEDHAANTAVAVAATEQAGYLVEELLVTELLHAGAVRGPAGAPDDLGAGTRRLVEVLTHALDRVPPGVLPDAVHREVTAALAERLDDVVDDRVP